ncbi:MAG TPA: hypothetical protein VF476_09205 [Chitinophagaceae bacterium]
MKKAFFIPILLLMCINYLHAQHNWASERSLRPGPPTGFFIRSPVKNNIIELPADGLLTGYENGRLLFRGEVKKQKLVGEWQSYYRNGFLLDSGYLLKGTPHGQWKQWDSSGQLRAIRHYDAGKLRRVETEMQLQHPKRSFFPLTSLYNQDRSAARHYLKSAYSFSFSSQISFRSLQQLVEHNGKQDSYIPVFSECLHHGLYMNFFAEGAVKDSGYYKNGLKEGVWIHRNKPGGSYITGAYRNGLRYREWKQYNAMGQLQSLTFYNRKGEAEQTKYFR